MAEIRGRARVRALAVTKRVGRVVEVEYEVVIALCGRVPHDLRVAQLAHREERERSQVALFDDARVASVDPVAQIDQLDVAVRPDRAGGIWRREIGFRLPVPADTDGRA